MESRGASIPMKMLTILSWSAFTSGDVSSTCGEHALAFGLQNLASTAYRMTMLHSRFTRKISTATAATLALGLCLMGSTVTASAQAIAVTVNGDPITTQDVEEQMKFLRIIRQPASREAAVESLVADRLKLHEANRFGISATDTDLTQTLNRVAAAAKMQPQALSNALQAAKGNSELIRQHFLAVAAWNNYVRARNKGLNVSEQDVNAALAKDANLAKNDADFTLQQIIFVIPHGSNPAAIEQRLHEAQALRERFQDCSSGLPLARALPDVGVKPRITRSANSMNEAMRKTLEDTPKGKLTPPSRSAEGIEMVAVCAKDDQADRTTVRDNVQDDLVAERLTKIADRMYQDLRKTAVIEKH
jgi:peptidyl-prolyl cis-trans isomerase SurA